MSTLPGLDKNVPIVMSDGRITPYMQRFWQNLQLVFANAATAIQLSGNQTVNGTKTFVSGLQIGSTGGPTWTCGTGAPGSAQPTGSLYSRLDGGAGSTLYVREGSSWVAK